MLNGPISRTFRPLAHTKAFPFMLPNWTDSGEFHWNMTSVQSYMEEGFGKNAVIYSAIMHKVRALTQAPLRAYTGDEDKPKFAPKDSPLALLAKRPNSFQSCMEFMQQCVVYKNLSGNCFIYMEKPSRLSTLPTAMYSLRPDRIKILSQNGKLAGYMYKPEGYQGTEGGFPILPEYMIHIRYPAAIDPLEGQGYGMSPIQPAAYSADVDNQFSKFLYMFFRHGGVGLAALEFEMPLNDPQIARIRTEWQELYGGAENWPKPLVLDNKGKYHALTPPFKDLASREIDGRNESRILGPLGVPGMLVGMASAMDRATFSNYEQADKAFWQTTMNADLLLFEVEFEHYLRDGEMFVKFDKSQVPALQLDMKQLADTWGVLVDRGMPPVIAAKVVGIEVERYEGDDISYLPSGTKPAVTDKDWYSSEQEAARERFAPKPEPDEENVPPKLPPGQPNKFLPAPHTKESDALELKAARIVEEQNRITEKHEPAYYKAAREVFGKQEKEILAFVTEAKQKAKQQKSSINWDVVQHAVLDYLNGVGVEEWRQTFAPVIRGLIEEGGEFWALELGEEFDVVNLFALDWFDRYTLRFATETNTTTTEQIKDVIQQAQFEGWSVPEAQARLQQLFQQWMQGDLTAEEFEWLNARMPDYRTEMIVRTETIRSFNAGTEALYKEWGVMRKQWWAAYDDRLCPFCEQMHGKILFVGDKFARLGERLSVMDESGKEHRMTVGFDDIGYPPLHPNCRCCLLNA